MVNRNVVSLRQANPSREGSVVRRTLHQLFRDLTDLEEGRAGPTEPAAAPATAGTPTTAATAGPAGFLPSITDSPELMVID